MRLQPVQSQGFSEGPAMGGRRRMCVPTAGTSPLYDALFQNIDMADQELRTWREHGAAARARGARYDPESRFKLYIVTGQRWDERFRGYSRHEVSDSLSETNEYARGTPLSTLTHLLCSDPPPPSPDISQRGLSLRRAVPCETGLIESSLAALRGAVGLKGIQGHYFAVAERSTRCWLFSWRPRGQDQVVSPARLPVLHTSQRR